MTVILELQTDRYGSETTLILTDFITGVRLAKLESLSSNTYYEKKGCLNEASCYQFEINDSWGDGLRYGGFYNFIVDGNVIATSLDDPYSNFGKGETVIFGDCPSEQPSISPTNSK